MKKRFIIVKHSILKSFGIFDLEKCLVLWQKDGQPLSMLEFDNTMYFIGCTTEDYKKQLFDKMEWERGTKYWSAYFPENQLPLNECLAKAQFNKL